MDQQAINMENPTRKARAAHGRAERKKRFLVLFMMFWWWEATLRATSYCFAFSNKEIQRPQSWIISKLWRAPKMLATKTKIPRPFIDEHVDTLALQRSARIILRLQHHEEQDSPSSSGVVDSSKLGVDGNHDITRDMISSLSLSQLLHELQSRNTRFPPEATRDELEQILSHQMSQNEEEEEESKQVLITENNTTMTDETTMTPNLQELLDELDRLKLRYPPTASRNELEALIQKWEDEEKNKFIENQAMVGDEVVVESVHDNADDVRTVPPGREANRSAQGDAKKTFQPQDETEKPRSFKTNRSQVGDATSTMPETGVKGKNNIDDKEVMRRRLRRERRRARNFQKMPPGQAVAHQSEQLVSRVWDTTRQVASETVFPSLERTARYARRMSRRASDFWNQDEDGIRDVKYTYVSKTIDVTPASMEDDETDEDDEPTNFRSSAKAADSGPTTQRRYRRPKNIRDIYPPYDETSDARFSATREDVGRERRFEREDLRASGAKNNGAASTWRESAEGPFVNRGATQRPFDNSFYRNDDDEENFSRKQTRGPSDWRAMDRPVRPTQQRRSPPQSPSSRWQNRSQIRPPPPPRRKRPPTRQPVKRPSVSRQPLLPPAGPSSVPPSSSTRTEIPPPASGSDRKRTRRIYSPYDVPEDDGYEDFLDRVGNFVANAADTILWGPEESSNRTTDQNNDYDTESGQYYSKRTSFRGEHWKDKLERRFDIMMGLHEEGKEYNRWKETDEEQANGTDNNKGKVGSQRSMKKPQKPIWEEEGNLMSLLFGRTPKGKNLFFDDLLDKQGKGSLLVVFQTLFRSALLVSSYLCRWASVRGSLPQPIVVIGVATAGICARPQRRLFNMIFSLVAMRTLGEVIDGYGYENNDSWKDEDDEEDDEHHDDGISPPYQGSKDFDRND